MAELKAEKMVEQLVEQRAEYLEYNLVDLKGRN